MRVTKMIAAAGAGVLMLSGCGFQGLYSAPLPGGADLGNHPFTIVAYFDDVLDLVPQSAVKVNDVAVGKVSAISLKGWQAKVTLEINDSVKLDLNSTAEIAQTSLLGEKYVGLTAPPMSQERGSNLTNGSVIKLDHTRSAAEVEQVLGALSLLLNEGGLRQIRVIGNELVTAFKGREPQIKDLLTRLNTFVSTLDIGKNDITNALVNIDKLAQTLNRQKQVLIDTLDTFPAALQVLSQERTKLVTLLTSLSRLGSVATNVINSTQTNLVTSLNALNPVLTQLRLSGSDFPESLKIAGTFPFPLGTTRTIVRGDYANLDATLNLDLTDTLCGLSKALCTGLNLASKDSAKVKNEPQPIIIRSGK
ncbi:MAG: MCE family protein [Jatrophihabitans sp.]